jgi:hypothetical protein
MHPFVWYIAEREYSMQIMRVINSMQRVIDSLNTHSHPSQIGFMLHDLLSEAGYGEKEILDAATAMANIAGAGIKR